MSLWRAHRDLARPCLVLLCGLVGVLAVVWTPPAVAAIAPGRMLPEVRLADWNGRPFRLAETRGQVVVVDFWASWCGGCKRALPALDGIARRHAGSGLIVLAVNVDGERAKGERFLAEYLPATAMTLLHDPDGAAMSRFGASGMPALYLVDREGRVVLAEAGYPPDRLESVEQAIIGLLAGSK